MEHRHRSLSRTLRSAVVASALCLAGVARAADEVKVMTSGAFTAAYLELAAQFEQTTPHRVATVTTSIGFGADSIPSRVKRGDAVDVVILPDAAIETMMRDGLIAPGSKVALATSAIGMAVRAGAPRPDIGSVEALRRTLLAARSVAYSASVSGDYLVNELFPRLGIADQMKAKSTRIERERVGAVVARGEAEVGFQQISELLPIAGIQYVGPLPPAVQRVTVISAGIAASAMSPDAARALLRFLASPAAHAVIKKSGLEPMAF